MKKIIVILLGLIFCAIANAQYIHPTDTTVSYKQMAHNDAKANYNGEGALVGVIYPVTLVCSPIVGLIPTAIGASTKIEPYETNCPNYYLYENNPEYRDEYDRTCKKIKSRKSWTHWGIATAINTVLLLLICNN